MFRIHRLRIFFLLEIEWLCDHHRTNDENSIILLDWNSTVCTDQIISKMVPLMSPHHQKRFSIKIKHKQLWAWELEKKLQSVPKKNTHEETEKKHGMHLRADASLVALVERRPAAAAVELGGGADGPVHRGWGSHRKNGGGWVAPAYRKGSPFRSHFHAGRLWQMEGVAGESEPIIMTRNGVGQPFCDTRKEEITRRKILQKAAALEHIQN